MFTLYVQKKYGDTKVVARSNDLLKLLKIEYMNHRKGGFLLGHTFIEDEMGCTCSFGDLSIENKTKFRKFADAVNRGAWFKSYDYLNRF